MKTLRLWGGTATAGAGTVGAGWAFYAYGVIILYALAFVTGTLLVLLATHIIGKRINEGKEADAKLMEAKARLRAADADYQRSLYAPIEMDEGNGIYAPRYDPATGQMIGGGQLAQGQPRLRSLKVEGNEQPAPAIMLPPCPTFGELRARGLITPGKLMLGYGLDAPIYGDWMQDMGSAVVAGIQDMGKSTLLRFLSAQMLMRRLADERTGIQLAISDIDKGAPKDSLSDSLAPLAHLFLSDVADTPESTLALLQSAVRMIDERKNAPGPLPDVLVIVEEYSYMMELGDFDDAYKPLVKAIRAATGQLIMRARKYGIRVVISGQSVSARHLGGGANRSCMPCFYAFRLAEKQAELLPFPGAKQHASTIARLEQGQALLVPPRQAPQVVRIPLTTDADIAALASQAAPAPRRNIYTFGDAVAAGKVASVDRFHSLPREAYCTEVQPQPEAVAFSSEATEAPNEVDIELAARVYFYAEAVDGSASQAYLLRKLGWPTGGRGFDDGKARLTQIRDALDAGLRYHPALMARVEALRQAAPVSAVA